MRNQRGVTLIEMMVMVTVIALFSGIAGVPYIGQAERARTVAVKNQLNAFPAALRKAPLMAQEPGVDPGADGAPGGDGASAHVFSWKCV
jgi:prepilin-type N-terminal cleavage/methylation domain-containing protein